MSRGGFIAMCHGESLSCVSFDTSLLEVIPDLPDVPQNILIRLFDLPQFPDVRGFFLRVANDPVQRREHRPAFPGLNRIENERLGGFDDVVLVSDVDELLHFQRAHVVIVLDLKGRPGGLR